MNDWKEIVSRYGPLVWHTVYRLLGDDADAADCYQETFLSALEVSSRQQIRSFSALLLRLATSRSIDRLRKRSRQPDSRTSPADMTILPSLEPGPAKEVQNWELAARLRRALGRLPAKEAEIFCLRHLSDMSYRQIAKQLDITRNTARVLLHRARKKIQLFFSGEF